MTKQEYEKLLQDAVISRLEQGVNPWQAPWINIQHNGISQHVYKGMNALLLSIISTRLYDGDPRWYTYDQAKRIGLQVHRGSKATPAFLFSDSYIRTRKDKYGNPILDENGKEQKERVHTLPVFKVYSLFNGRQIDGLGPFIPDNDRPIVTANEIAAQKIMDNSPVPIIFTACPEAYYSPDCDKISMPGRIYFREIERFYSTAFHEMIHSTGNAERFDREYARNYAVSRDMRAREELVAEIGAVALCDQTGMQYAHDQSASYIQSWLGELKTGDLKLADLYDQVSPAVRYLNATAEERPKIIERFKNQKMKTEDQHQPQYVRGRR